MVEKTAVVSPKRERSMAEGTKVIGHLQQDGPTAPGGGIRER